MLEVTPEPVLHQAAAHRGTLALSMKHYAHRQYLRAVDPDDFPIDAVLRRFTAPLAQCIYTLVVANRNNPSIICEPLLMPRGVRGSINATYARSINRKLRRLSFDGKRYRIASSNGHCQLWEVQANPASAA